MRKHTPPFLYIPNDLFIRTCIDDSSKAYKSDGERGGEEKEKLKRRERETPPPPLRNLQVEERKGKEKGRKEGTEPKKKGMKERMKRKEGTERNGKERNEGDGCQGNRQAGRRRLPPSPEE